MTQTNKQSSERPYIAGSAMPPAGLLLALGGLIMRHARTGLFAAS